MAKEELGNLYFGLFVSSIIPLTLIYIGYASTLIGILLLTVFAVYMYQLAKTGKAKEDPSSSLGAHNPWKHTILTLLSANAVVFLSYLVLISSSNIAGAAGIKREVIGGTVVAFGTSVPVLMASVRAVRKGHFDLALGNIVGTCFMNTTCILGATLAVSPLRVDITAFSNLVMFSVVANLFLWYFLSSEKITLREGVVFLFMYFLFLTISFSGYRA
jgi:cation:H+ antiporter